MKTQLLFISLLLAAASPALAQETPAKRDTIRVGVDAPAPPVVEEEIVVENGDTTIIKVSGKTIIIVKSGEGTHIDIEKPEEAPRRVEEREYEYRYDSKSEEDHADHDEDEDDEDREGRRDKADVGFYGLDLGLSNLYYAGNINSDIPGMGDFSLKNFQSLNVSNHFLPTRVPLDRKGHLNLKTAITLDFNWYHFTNGKMELLDGQSNILPVDTFETVYDKNKLRTFYVQLPLMLNFNTDAYGEDDGVSFSVGAYAGVLANAQQILGSKEDKIRYEGMYNLSTFRYGVMARLDFEWFDIYANYCLSPFFKEGQGPMAQTISAGINIIDF